METAILIALVVIIVILIVVIFRKRVDVAPKHDGEGLKLILEQVNELSRVVDRKVGDLVDKVDDKVEGLTKAVDTRIHQSSKSAQESMQVQLTESAKLVREITQEITSIKEIGRQNQGFAEQLQSLQDILKNPKQRGILGEYYLETLLKNVLAPGQYMMQYAFKNGEIVDAAVFVKDKIIPIDSKFSLENYNKMVSEKNIAEKDRLEKVFVGDLKMRILETSKYIRPNENTMDFAFMFIPHEAIYYDLLINKIGSATDETDNLIQRAAGKYKVIIVSPTSFLAYLQTVLQGLKAMQIEETAKDIVKRVEDLGNHLKRYEEYHVRLGSSLGTVVNHYNNSGKELKKVDKDILRITGSTPGIDVNLIEKPEEDMAGS